MYSIDDNYCIGGFFYGIYGMLVAILITAIVLAVLEIGYIHYYFFDKKLFELCKIGMPLCIAGFFVCLVETYLPVPINNYFDFFCFGVIFTVINGLICIIVSAIFYRAVIWAVVKKLLDSRDG